MSARLKWLFPIAGAALMALTAVATAKDVTLSFYYPIAVGGPLQGIMDGYCKAFQQETGIAVAGDAHHGSVTPFGELGAIGSDEQREVRELRRLDANALEDEQVFERVGEVILASNDVGDIQIGVVDA